MEYNFKGFGKGKSMKDQDNIFDANNIEKPLYEVNNDKNFENFKKGSQEAPEGLWGQSQNYEKEKEADGVQGKANGRQEGSNFGESGADDSVNTQFSSYYSPPYYVPNFTVSEPSYENTQHFDTPHKVKKGKNGLFIAIIAVLSVIVCLLFVVMIKLFQNFSGYETDPLDLGREEINVIQNSPQININKETDEDYVPLSLPEVVSKVGNSVVEIQTSEMKSSFHGQYVTSGAGSGVIVAQSDSAGYLLTNFHVVFSNSTTPMDSITVVLTNDDKYSATVIGSDESLDLALLRIEKTNKEKFTVADFADSSKLVVGQDVIAIGNPLGSLGGTVTDGIVSALDRRVNIDGITMVLLQHNAAINPGNSGGALFDMMGNLVGIVNAKSSDSGIEGLGFAIPSNIALNFINRVMVLEPAIGINVQYGRLNGTYGIYVVSTTNSDFLKYDRIIAINGQIIENAAQYYAIIDSLKIGDTAEMTVNRSGVKKEIKVTLSE